MRDEDSDLIRVVDIDTLSVSEGMTLPEGVPDPYEANRDLLLSPDGGSLWFVQVDEERDIWMLQYEKSVPGHP